MAWFYTVLLAGCSAGIVVLGVTVTRRLFRDETLFAPSDAVADASLDAAPDAGGER